MDYKPALGALSVAIMAVAYAIYISQTAKDHGVQPHPFSWLLWGFVTTVAALAQHAKAAGPGTWVTAFTAGSCFVIGTLTLLKHKWQFSRFDWLSLGTGLAVFAFYLLARDPALSAVLATTTDVAGYLPTLKKGWREPHGDSATSFTLNSVKFVPALFALNSYSVATWLYPATLVVVNAGVATMLLMRRKQLRLR